MSRWEEGRVYDYYGRSIRCTRRYFDGALEMVDLEDANPPVFRVRWPDDTEHEIRLAEPLTRTARTLAPCVVPRVTETLGGVTRPDRCDHQYYRRVIADAGPFAGRECCDACGVPPDEPWASAAMLAVIEAVERRAREGFAPLCTHLDPRPRRARR